MLSFADMLELYREVVEPPSNKCFLSSVNVVDLLVSAHFDGLSFIYSDMQIQHPVLQLYFYLEIENKINLLVSTVLELEVKAQGYG